MAFYKEQKMKTNGKYYPVAVLVDRPAEIDEVAQQIAEASTVAKADIVAVLASLPSVMARLMNAGRSVHLTELGHFRYTINAKRGGQDTPEKVTAADVESTRIRFTPETGFAPGRAVTTRALSDGVRWVKFNGTPVDDTGAGSGGGGTEGGGGNTGGGSGTGDEGGDFD